MKKTVTALAIGALFAGAASAASYTLTFEQGSACNGPCSNGMRVFQGYGDVAGIVDITYTDIAGTGSLKWWDDSYNDLRGVLWSGSGDAPGASRARIEIKPLNGQAVTLNSMDFGAWANATRPTNISVTAIGGGPVLFSFTGNVGLGSTEHQSFSQAVSSANGLWIEWMDTAFNVGIDNVRFTIAPVPEPEAYAMFLAGLGILGAVARRRKR